MVVPQNGWFIMENPIKNGWFGGISHYFRKHPTKSSLGQGFGAKNNPNDIHFLGRVDLGTMKNGANQIFQKKWGPIEVLGTYIYKYIYIYPKHPRRFATTSRPLEGRISIQGCFFWWSNFFFQQKLDTKSMKAESWKLKAERGGLEIYLPKQCITDTYSSKSPYTFKLLVFIPSRKCSFMFRIKQKQDHLRHQLSERFKRRNLLPNKAYLSPSSQRRLVSTIPDGQSLLSTNFLCGKQGKTFGKPFLLVTYS